MAKEKPIVIELYELWNQIKSRFNIVSPQPKSFTLRKEVIPILSLDGSKLDIIDLSDNTVVAHTNGTVDVLLQAPSGFIYKVRGLQYQANAVGTTGTHRLDIQQTDGTLTINMGYLASNFGANILISGSSNESLQFYADASERPSTPDAQMLWVTNTLIASHTDYLNFKYTNNTDVNTSTNRLLRVLVEIIPERA